MNISHSLPTRPQSLGFSFLSGEEIRDISVKQITNPQLLDNLNLPTSGGLYDPALGPSDRRDLCATCSLSSYACPGHFGHIELPVPVYHPLFMNQTYGILRSCCFFCHQFKMPAIVLKKFEARLRLLDHGLLAESHVVGNMQPLTRDKEGGGEMDVDGEEEDEEKDEKIPLETVESFSRRIDEQVRKYIEESMSILDEGVADVGEGSEDVKPGIAGLDMHSKLRDRRSSGRDNYKDGMVYDERRALLNDFGRKAYAKCSNCNAVSYTFRKEGTLKLIEYDLSKKHRDQHRALRIVRPDILKLEKHERKLALAKKNGPARNGHSRRRLSQGSEDNDSGHGESLDSDADSAMEDNAIDMEDAAEEESEDGADIEMAEVAGMVARGANGNAKGASGRDERIISVSEVRAHLRRLFRNQPRICGLLYGRHGTSSQAIPTARADIFFMDVVPVPPTRFRPASKLGESMFENPQNSLLSKVMVTGNVIVDLNRRLQEATLIEKSKELEQTMLAVAQAERQRLYTNLLEAIFQLQHDVNSFLDSSKNPVKLGGGLLPPAGVKQALEKKDGLFRKHMMGKRVNFAARSVISPDINIETNEIGVPPVFAKKLTFPEPVTPHNVHYLRQLVIRGPKEHPGATMIQNEDGSQVSLDKKSLEERTALANQLLTPQEGLSAYDTTSLTTQTAAINKKVLRHLKDGDILLLNRQPTLHKPSMMAHRAKVLTGEKTIRMHYANCNSYNADFDGDEMNIHFPQSEVAQAEARMIANTDNQYLGPTSGNPLRGLIQDHVVSGVHMCNKSTFFTREEYHQLIYGALRTEDGYTGKDKVLTVAPAMWKPRPLWTGKQLITTIMLNLTPTGLQGLTMESRNKIPNELWQRDNGLDPNMSEETAVFLDGYLVRGVLDKSQYGASAYGLVHSVFEVYGPEKAGRLLGILSRLLTKYLQHIAFTCRMDDLILTKQGEQIRSKILADAKDSGARAALGLVGLPADADLSDETTQRNLAIRLEETLRSDDLMGDLDAVMQTAFNKTTSAINREVVPNHLVKPFPENNMQTMTISGAKGSKVNATQISTLLGQQALEGRRVPTMVSGKTLPSFKAFDTAARAGGFVANRFLTGIRPQEYYFHCMAGREGLIDTAVKTSRSGYLQRCLIKHLEGARVHYDHTVRDSDGSVLQFYYGEDALDVVKQKHLYQFDFSVRNLKTLANRYRAGELKDKVKLDVATRQMKKALQKPYKYSPALSMYSPSRNLGSMSEKYAREMQKWADENKAGLLKAKKSSKGEGAVLPRGIRQSDLVDADTFMQMSRMRYLHSLVDPGEAVGLLASEGVGEPSTQMTLNTFHLAGHGAANVTLGIPRLREIVMTAATKPKTPTMKLAVSPEISEETLDKFIKASSRLTLSQVVERVTVIERLSAKSIEQVDRRRTYTVTLHFFPPEEYSAEYRTSPKQILLSMPASFAVVLQKEIAKEFKEATKALANDIASVGKGHAVREAANELNEESERAGRDDELDDDGDAYEMKRKQQSEQVTSYESDEEDNGDLDEEDVLAKRVEALGDDEVEVETAEISDAAGARARAELDMEDIGEAFKDISKYATSFSFDLKGGLSCEFDLEFTGKSQKLLLIDVIERCCRAAVIHEIPSLGRCIKLFDDKGSFTGNLLIEGSNLTAMWREAEDLTDIHRLDSNDIYAISQTYGVEAGRASVIREMTSVFGAYGIAVDFRHLSIIADYMTHEGGYKPFNRTGIASKSSPLLKASFETTMSFLSDATLRGDFDDLRSPSGNIVVGAPMRTGTGSFDVRMQS